MIGSEKSTGGVLRPAVQVAGRWMRDRAYGRDGQRGRQVRRLVEGCVVRLRNAGEEKMKAICAGKDRTGRADRCAGVAERELGRDGRC